MATRNFPRSAGARAAAFRSAQTGAGKVKAIFWTAVLLFIAYVLFQVAPPLMDKYELEDLMRTEARFAVVNKKDAEEIRDAIWRKVQDLEMDRKQGIRRDNIKVQYMGRSIAIEMPFEVQVNLLFTTYTLDLKAEAGDRAL